MSDSFVDVPVGNKTALTSSPSLVFLTGPPPMRRQSSMYEIRIGNPQKVTTDSKLTNNYVTYTIKTVVKGTGAEHVVTRRYSDFAWLHETLTSKHPVHVIPALPEKSITSRFAAALVEYRVRELEKFLQRVAAHPVLVNDEAFLFFLTTPPADFAKHNVGAAASHDEDASSSAAPGSGVLGSLMSFGSKASKTAMKTTVSAVGSISQAIAKPVDDPDVWFTETVARLDQMESAISGAVLATGNFLRMWGEIPGAYSSLAASLRVVGRVLAATDEWSAVAASHATNSAEQCQVLSFDLVSQIDRYFQQNLTDYVRELNAIRAVVDHRASIVRRHAAAIRACQAAREKGKDPAEADRARDQIAAELEDCSKKSRADIERAMEERKVEFHHVLRGLAALNMEFSMQCADAWKELAVRMPSDASGRPLSGTMPAVTVLPTAPGSLAPAEKPYSTYQQTQMRPVEVPVAQPEVRMSPHEQDMQQQRMAAAGIAHPNPFAESVNESDSPFSTGASSSLL